MRWVQVLRCTVWVGPLALAAALAAADEFERPPIEYSRSTPANQITALQARLDAGELEIAYDDQFGYLPAVLAALDIPVESQMLVFSKTSLQMSRISPRTPRAIYFNDDVYLGYCHSGDVLEVSAVDPQLGTVFYTLSQRTDEPPRFQRQTDNCLICHGSSRTEGVPGHVVRSLFVDAGGQPKFAAGSRMVDHTTPLADRWGGWYVTGEHGAQTHLGNLIIRSRNVPRPVDNSEGHNVVRLDDRFDVSNYLTPHSDLVALMVLEHQVLVHNRLTKANFATRQALAYDTMLNEALEEHERQRLDSTNRRIHSAGEELLDALLLVGEAPLTDTLRGTAGFAEKFVAAGPRDGQGRSLRDLDLKTRLLKYPCSYLIYSTAFDRLPRDVRDYVWLRLGEIVSGADSSEKFAHLSAADRQAIGEILRDTHPDLPPNWPAAPPAGDGQ